jgi:hypothetical protein
MNVTTRKVLSPTELLLRRINREFPKKRLIGDIAIKDHEYALLMARFRAQYTLLRNSSNHIIIDNAFAVALVQIGIKHYDGGFWPHVAEELGVESLPPHHSTWIGESFYRTLIKNDKLHLEQGEWMKNILMHCFVSDYYAENLYNFLFAYYRMDLERDLLRNNREMMNSFVETILKNDKTGRTYWLVRHTSDAVHINTKGAKIRLRRLLRLIDNCFWEQTTPVNSSNRLSMHFWEWQKNSNDFNLEYVKYHGGNYAGRGKKSFSTPFFQCDFPAGVFKLNFPTQLISFAHSDDVYWNVSYGETEDRLEVNLYQGVTGYKTEEKYLELKASKFFSEYNITLMCGNLKLRRFKITADDIRFFDKNGDFIHSEKLPSGEVFSFSQIGATPVSEAIVGSERVGDLLLSYFDFQYGDIVRLPDGKPVSIGKKLEEGLLPRGRMNGAYALNNEGEQIFIYNKAPALLLKMLPSRTPGTLIQVNGRNFRLFDQETVVVDIDERSGEKGYIINTSDYGCSGDGIYQMLIDVPNDKSRRHWEFTVINEFGFEFEDAPYIFSNRGTIRFEDKLKIIAERGSEKLHDENAFNFKIDPNCDDIVFSFLTDSATIPLRIYAPAFKWKFDNGNWQIKRPPEIWHSEFPTMIYIKHPDDSLTICMDDDGNYETQEQAQSYNKLKEKHLFECDMTRFKSWFGREAAMRRVMLHFHDDKKEFIRVVTKSTAMSCIIRGDYENDILVGEVDIIGKARYYADIRLNDSKLAEKVVINRGQFELQIELVSGKYSIDIFEEEDDDTGFGDICYFPVAHFEQDLLNPNNLRGKCIEVKRIRDCQESSFYLPLNYRFTIENLSYSDELDKHNYTGLMFIDNSTSQDGRLVAAYPVNVNFYDTDKLKYVKLSFLDDDEPEVFLYDSKRKIIVKEENRDLPRTERYRRYTPLYEDEYIFTVDFVAPSNRMPKSMPTDIPKEKVKQFQNANQSYRNNKSSTVFTQGFWKSNYTTGHTTFARPAKPSTFNSPELIPIENLQLSQKTYDCLKRARILTAGDIANRTITSLFKVRNLGRKNMEEAINKIKLLGLDIKGE